MGNGVIEHGGCRTLYVGDSQNGRLALQVCHHHGVRMLCLELQYCLYRELLVYVAASVPQQHRAARHTVDVVAKVVVGTEDYLLVLRERRHHLLGIARRYHNIGQSLDSRSSVDIAHHLVSGMFVLELLQIFGTTRVGKRASGCEIGAQHLLVGRKQLARFGHKVNSTHHNHLGIGLCCLAGKGQ